MSSSTASGWSLESTSFAFAVNKINLLQRYFVASKFLAIETRQTGRKRGITAASAFPCVRKPLHDTTLRAFTQPTVACCLRPIDQQARAALFDQAPSLYASRTERSFGIRRPPTRACFFCLRCRLAQGHLAAEHPFAVSSDLPPRGNRARTVAQSCPQSELLRRLTTVSNSAAIQRTQLTLIITKSLYSKYFVAPTLVPNRLNF